MGEFFKPWRRKVGTVTLLLALVSVVGWVRSFYFTDLITFPTANALNRLISDKHGVVWTIESQTAEEHAEVEWESLFGIPVPNIFFSFPQSLDLHGKVWKRNCAFLGFGFLEGQIFGRESTMTVRIVPYWSVVFPLTLLSAYLLLSKPRKSNQKKTTEPITEKLR